MTPNTPHTVGHVGWSPDYKGTPKLPAIGELIARRSAAPCSPSSDDLPTSHPSGAWNRSDFVREYEKRCAELHAAREVLSGIKALISMTDTRGWISHDQRLAVLGNIRAILPENAEPMRGQPLK